MSHMLSTPVPVYHVRFRYPHHASPSGYDRLGDYVGEPVRMSRAVYLLGETVLRLPAKLMSWYGGHFEYSRHDFVMEFQARLHMTRHRRSIYHVAYGEKSLMFLARLNGYRGHRIMATFHHPPEHYPRLFRSTEHLKRIEHAVTVSTSQVEFLEALVGKGRVTFVPYGVDTEWFRPAEPPREEPPCRCLFVGHHLRDFVALPEVVRSVLAARKDTEFILISQDARAGRAASDPRVKWFRRVPDAEYLAYLQGARLLVLPLRGSTTVTSVLEAFACGVPVVTNAGGISDYLDPHCAVALPTGRAREMTDAVLEILGQPDRHRRMSEAARARALEFAWPRIAEKMIPVYERIAGTMA